MHQKLSNAILQTLCYSDIFEYPLTQQEIYKYLHADNFQFSIFNFQKTVKLLLYEKKISVIDKYYCLKGREKIVATRKEREKISEEKIAFVKHIASFLSKIPTISFIGISGSLAIKNSTKDSDIDLFFITKPYTVWISRFLVHVLLILLRAKRSKEKNKGLICPNMFMDEKYLCLSKEKQTLYSAHELAQLYPLVGEKMLEHLLLENIWIQDFLPNSAFEKIKTQQRNPLWTLCIPGEYLLMKAQLWYMKGHKTREITTPYMIAFHPVDYEKIIMREYKRRLKQYGI